MHDEAGKDVGRPALHDHAAQHVAGAGRDRVDPPRRPARQVLVPASCRRGTARRSLCTGWPLASARSTTATCTTWGRSPAPRTAPPRPACAPPPGWTRPAPPSPAGRAQPGSGAGQPQGVIETSPGQTRSIILPVFEASRPAPLGWPPFFSERHRSLRGEIMPLSSKALSAKNSNPSGQSHLPVAQGRHHGGASDVHGRRADRIRPGQRRIRHARRAQIKIADRAEQVEAEAQGRPRKSPSTSCAWPTAARTPTAGQGGEGRQGRQPPGEAEPPPRLAAARPRSAIRSGRTRSAAGCCDSRAGR